MITKAQQKTMEDLARFIQSTYSQEDIDKAVAELYEPPWENKYINAETGKTYVPHHESERQAVFSDTPIHLILKGGEGSGKALALDTPLPTPTGWTTMDEVQPGDVLLDEQGIPCCVMDVSPIMHDHQCYEIIFDDEWRIVADARHLWLTTDSPTRKSLSRRGEKYTTGTHAHLPHCQPKYEPAVCTTEEIYRTLKDRRGFTNHAISLASPLILPTVSLPIDPWMLGAWLGDGTSRAAAITIGAQDRDEMVALIRAAGHSVVFHKIPTQFGIDTDHSVLKDHATNQFVRNPEAFFARLDNLNLIRNKHIPQSYLRGDYNQRLALMQGLMDTDGYINEEGRCEYCSASKQLADDFAELCASLSIKAVCKKGSAKCNGKIFVRYRFSFVPYVPIFRLTRKARYVKSPGRQFLRRFRHFIVDVREHDSVPVKCVVVDSPSHLFLAGRGMIPTHNSVAGIVKTLERLRRSMSGLMLSPDLPHFRRSLWPEFRRWCPWEQVVPEHQYRSKFSWEPRAPFVLAFKNGATLMCGGIDDPGAWEGPNISFAHFDEARRKKTAAALKVLTGRVRIPGPKGEPPQIYFTTTPRKHWLHEYFGPLRLRCDSCSHRYEHYTNTEPGVTYINLSPDMIPTCPRCGSENYLPDDNHAAFKLNSMVLTLLTKENEGNLQEGFTENRALSLTSAEARVLLDAEWEDIEASERFLPSMLMWDLCRTELPPLGPREPLVVAMDAATGRTNEYSDCFGMLGVTRYPPRSDTVAVRLVQKWQARPGAKIDFWGTEKAPGPERVLRTLAKEYNVVVVTYDPYQLHDMGTRLSRERIAWMSEFSQAARRTESDTDLLNLITHRRILHDGNTDLRDHIDNADRKTDTMGKKLRIVKREDASKIDLTVCLSMASAKCLQLSL